MVVFVVIILTFALCFGLDKAFTKLFRSQPQHMSGKAVRLHKYYGVGGLLLTVLGIGAIFTGIRETMTILIVGGGLILLVGIGLIVYFLTFGVFYDEDTFLVASFGKKTGLYRFNQIRGQKLYNNAGQTLIELYLGDGRTVQLQSSMPGAYDFLDHAFAAWCAQRGKTVEDCPFHDPDNSLWFPTVED